MPHTLIIAEAGVNHNGNMEIAKKLIDVAAKAGVDYIKFQTFKAENLVSKDAKMASYQQKNIGTTDNSQFAMLKKLELSPEQHIELIEYCRLKNINFFSTAFDLETIDFLTTLNLGVWKIPSGEITNYPYLKKVAQIGEPVILSTGMCTIQEIENAVSVLLKWGLIKEKITILHCNTEYPTPFADVNLKAMDTIRKRFGVNVGYSDHTNGIEIPIAAVALGATVIEKHFTLDKNLPGPDHKASLEPVELAAMVTAIRNVEQAISGSGEKVPSPSEIKNIEVARKSIVAAYKIEKGELYSESNLTTKRPGNGISPMRWIDVIGKRAIRKFEPDEPIEL